MTPLDDELRSTLSRRADLLTPSPDPLAGIEARATRLRRRRAALAVSGAVAVVAAVALAVPALVPGRTTVVTPGTTPSATATPTAPVATAPANLLGWDTRGKNAYSPGTYDLQRRFAQELGRPDAPTSYAPLYVGQVDGVSFDFGQMWFDGDDVAYTVGIAVGPDNVPQYFVGPVTPKDPWGLAFLAGGMQSYQLLVVVTGPGTGQVSYAAKATGPFEPAPFTDGVALVHRDLQASDDRLQVLDGNGDLDHPLYEGPVTPLLCDLRTC
jgi:hypothetical protein